MSLLTVTDLTVKFHTRNGVITANDNVSFSVDQGKITAIVGESGSGKSVCCYSLLDLIPQPPGRIESGTALFEGDDLLQMSKSEIHNIRGDDIALIFQDPMTCLNPFITVGEQIIEPLIYHRGFSRAEARERAIEVIDEVGITRPEERLSAYPHEFSGGMRQRVMIAMALITEPKLLIADEPTTALDVTIQAQILELIAELQTRRNIGVIFISHDLAVVSDIADQVVVMEKGKVVESGTRQKIFSNAEHPYTQKLLASVPTDSKTVIENNNKNLVEVRNLNTWFKDQANNRIIKAVNDVSFDIQRGEILGLVGESGSGKSTIGRSILRLVNPKSGSILFDGTEVSHLSRAEMLPLRKRMQMIFQDPYASLNPRMTVFDTLAEPILLHGIADRKNIYDAVLKLVDDVGLAKAAIKKYPHEFSGGQRQRITIGRAIASQPDFIVADEPVSALDVTIQAQILDLIEQLAEERNLTMLFISHDLSVVRHLCNRVMVVRHGKLVEHGDTEQIFNNPKQEYTQNLIKSIPTLAALST